MTTESSGIWIIRLVLLPFIAVGIYLAFQAVGQTMAQGSGRPVSATIEQLKIGRRGGTYAICHYSLNGELFSGNVPLSKTEYNSMNPGSTLQVKAVELFGRGYCVRSDHTWGQTILFAAFSVVWISLVSLWVLLFFIFPIVFRLVRPRA